MIIAQITDLHVVDPGRLCCGRVETNPYVRAAVEHVNGLDPLPDAVVVSGDLVDDGSPAQYAELRSILDGLRPPYYVIPGNHDERQALLEAFADHEYMPRPGSPFVQYAIDTHPVRLIGLDTNVPGRPHGELCDARLAWLAETLGEEPDRPTLLFMHHPPFRTGIPLADECGLRDARQFETIVRRNPQVVRVACGHVHRPIHVAWGGTIASVCPSTAHQVTLKLGGEPTTDGGLVMEPPVVQLHVFDPDCGLVTHASYVGAYETFG